MSAPLAVLGVGGLWGLLAARWVLRRSTPCRLPVRRLDRPARPIGRPAGRRPEMLHQLQPWHLGAATGLGLVLLAAQPALAPAPFAGLVGVARHRRHQETRSRERSVVDQLPDFVDLLRLTTLAGLPISVALGAIGDRPGGVLGQAVARAAHLVERGATTAQAMDALVESCGTPMRSLVDALNDHDRYGTPLAPALDRLGLESRLRRRRQAEEDARRLPVTLLFPLVFTTLPAFVLLTIVPMLVGSFSSLSM